MSNYKFYIVTGDPGVGKTTLIKNILTFFASKGLKTSGFYTEEVRKNCVREGFDVVTFDGKRGRLARDQALINGPVRYRVGKYAVLVQEFENVALPCMTQQEHTKSQLLVIDEIGKMEFFSEKFKQNIKHIFSSNSDHTVLATIPIRRSDTLIESIRNHNKAKVWTVTRENRNNIHEDILKEMTFAFNIPLNIS